MCFKNGPLQEERQLFFLQESLFLLLFVLHSFLKPLLNSPPPGSSDEVSLEQESEDDIHSSRSSLDRQSHHRANTTMHVCWYRNTSVSMTDHSVAVEVPRRAQLSRLPLSVLARSASAHPPLHAPFCHWSTSAVCGSAWVMRRPLHVCSPSCMSACPPSTCTALSLQQAFVSENVLKEGNFIGNHDIRGLNDSFGFNEPCRGSLDRYWVRLNRALLCVCCAAVLLGLTLGMAWGSTDGTFCFWVLHVLRQMSVLRAACTGISV